MTGDSDRISERTRCVPVGEQRTVMGRGCNDLAKVISRPAGGSREMLLETK